MHDLVEQPRPDPEPAVPEATAAEPACTRPEPAARADKRIVARLDPRLLRVGLRLGQATRGHVGLKLVFERLLQIADPA